MKERIISVIRFIFIMASLSYIVHADVNPDDAYTDPKNCGFVPRNSDGTIKRSAAEVNHFQLVNPCPSTGLTTGSCPGWAADHIIPLACGGCDKIVNLQWLPTPIKSCSGIYCKDRFERKIQYYKGPITGMTDSGCRTALVPVELNIETEFSLLSISP